VELVVRSHGRLHVFLPLLDRGVDGLVHRIDDGSWFPVQVKGRSKLRSGSLQADRDGRGAARSKGDYRGSRTRGRPEGRMSW
jgi:hypothetical protein